MDTLEHVTAALARLGVKTCANCGRTGAKSLCKGCRTVNYCGKECQAAAWAGHKRECRRVVRDRAEAERAAFAAKNQFRDPIAAAYAADEAMAADACRAV